MSNEVQLCAARVVVERSRLMDTGCQRNALGRNVDDFVVARFHLLERKYEYFPHPLQ